MSISAVNSGSAPAFGVNTGTSATSASYSVTAGNALIIAVNATLTSGLTPTVTANLDPAGANTPLTLDYSFATGSGSPFFTIYKQCWFSIFNVSGGSHTVKITLNTTGYLDVLLLEVSGLLSSGSYDSAVSAETESGTSPHTMTGAAALATPTNEIALSFSAQDSSNGAATTSSTGWVTDASSASTNAGGYALAHQVYTAGGSITPSLSWVHSDAAVQETIVAYQGATGGATDPFPLIYRIPSPTIIRL